MLPGCSLAPSCANRDAHRSSEAPAAAPARSVDEAALDRFIEEQRRTHHFQGLEAVIVKHGRVVFQKGYGWAVEGTAPVTNDTVFRLASISKTFTAVLLMKLLEEHRIGLDDDVNGALGFAVRHPRYPDSPITYRMLLSHHAAIADNYDYEHAELLFPPDGDAPVALAEFVAGYFRPGGAYYDAARNFTAAAPGTAFQYSNLGYTLAGLLVEKLAGTSLEAYAEAALFRPLGMTDVSWRTRGFAPKGGMATPYKWEEGTGFVAYGQFGYPDWPAGSLRVSGTALAKFMRLFLGRGKVDGVTIVSEAVIGEMTQVQFPATESQYGLGVYYVDDPRLVGNARLGHNGGEGGVRTEMYWRSGGPDGVGVILLGNSGQRYDKERKRAFAAVRDELFAYGETTPP
jgi:CubicO group peptidase (beta-lactamase class C family)